jgi:hypothetical protein
VLTAILCLAPALALVLPLLLRRYPGERLLVVVAERRRTRWPLPRSSVARRRLPRLPAVRGGQLLARSLAVRPPPLAPAAH